MSDLQDAPTKPRKPRNTKVAEKKKSVESSKPKGVIRCKALKNWNANLNGTVYNFIQGDTYELTNPDHVEKFTHPYINVLEVIK